MKSVRGAGRTKALARARPAKAKRPVPKRTGQKDSNALSFEGDGRLERERRAHANARRHLKSAREDFRRKALECEEIRARYEAALRGAQVHAFTQDRDLRYTWIFNPQEPDAVGAMLGRTDAELGSSPQQDLVLAAKRRVLETGEPADTEASFITPEGRSEFALHIEPVRSPEGAVEGLMCSAIDVSRIRLLESERRRLSEELATAAERFEFALRGSNVAVFTQDRNLRYTSVSKPIFGRDISEINGKTDGEILAAQSADAVIALKNDVLTHGETRNAELRIDVGAMPLWYDFHLEPMRDVSGSITGITGAAVDITERKRNEAHLRLLLRELTHRSKNLLAVIQAMARQTARHGGTVQSFVERFGERVQALARSHDLLIAESWRSVSLRDLVRSQLSHYIDREPHQIGIEGPDINLRPEAAQSLGLALHELASNAAKYGAMSKAGGRVDISWQESAADVSRSSGFELTWRESGGPKVAAPKNRGFGSMAIEHNLARALDAAVSLDFEAEGVTCRISVPPSQIAARS